MNKLVKKILVFIILLSLIAIVILLSKMNSRLTENPPDYAGNTAGNLYNRGLFAEDENYIYFASLADNYRLYRMNHSLEDVTRLSKDSAEYINPDSSSSCLYYSRINYRMNTLGSTAFDILNTGIYRLSLKNKELSRLYPDACGTVFLAGNNLFYQAYGKDGNFDLYSLATNRKNPAGNLVTTDYINPVSYHNGLLYYAGVTEDHCLYALSPETGISSLSADIDCFLPIVTDKGIYFLSQKHNYALYYLPNTSDTATLLADTRLSAYNLSTDEQTLFYQVDNQKNNRLCRYDIAEKKETTILDGNYKNLNTVSGYLFFTDFAETVCYCYDISADTIFSFMPSAED